MNEVTSKLSDKEFIFISNTLSAVAYQDKEFAKEFYPYLERAFELADEGKLLEAGAFFKSLYEQFQVLFPLGHLLGVVMLDYTKPRDLIQSREVRFAANNQEKLSVIDFIREGENVGSVAVDEFAKFAAIVVPGIDKLFVED